MKKLVLPKKFLEKRIPTILGISVLVISLIAGTILIGQGGGVFSPRASVETTPKKVKTTNVLDSSFTISFLTDSKTAGFVKYGTEANSVKSQAGDDRDQISGTVGEFQLHHITVRGLQQNTTYYYTVGTGSGSIFDDDGQPFRIKTTSRNGAPAAAKTIYGSVVNQAGAPANGSIVYVDVDGAGTMSSQVKASGSWAIPLSNARTKDGSAYAEIVDDNNIIINVQGPLSSQVASVNTSVANAQPVAEITFGQSGQIAVDPTTIATPRPTPIITPTPEPTAPAVEDDLNEKQSSRSGILEELLSTDSTSSENAISVTELDLDADEHQTLTTPNPTIMGKAPVGITVSIVVNSDTQIQQEVVVDENGEFTLDISQLSESLEPGEHTVTYTYTDPETGKVVEKTVEFTVEETPEQLALADTESTAPYGSGNPYPIETPVLATESATATDSAATDEARTTVATDEAVPVSGSVGTTLALVFGGLFFIISGLWSFWISNQLEKGELEG